MPDTHASFPATAAPQQGGGIPAEIAKAIGAVMAQVKALPKGEHNAHGGYAFASIDDFLAFVGPLCSSAGLIVIQDEESADLIDRGSKGWLKVTYSFTLAHTGGALWDRPMRRSVLQPVTGPQTTGSSQSYALKQFLRSLFQIPTGDRDDADYHAKTDMPAAQQPAPPQKAPQRPAQRDERPARANPAPRAAERAQEPPADPGGPTLMQIPLAPDGAVQIGAWAKAAGAALEGKPEKWRRAWLEMHEFEVDELRKARREWADRLVSLAIAPDLAPLPAAAE